MANRQHALRMKKLIDTTSGTIILGGETGVNNLCIAPTIMTNIRPDDLLMDDEIFGPILAVMTAKNEDETIQLINTRCVSHGYLSFAGEHALTVYVFSQDADFRNKGRFGLWWSRYSDSPDVL